MAQINDCTHEWRPMTWQEAYPASSGKVCVKCDTYKLGWLCEINQPDGDEIADKMAAALNGMGSNEPD